jgi:hypothetical protein
MKLLFASSDPKLVQQFKYKLELAGIASEVRNGFQSPEAKTAGYPELWIPQEGEFQTAVSLFARFHSQRN